MRIAYLTSQYPAASHTFIRREVAALRRAGVDITTFSVRRPDDDEVKSDADRAAHAETGYVLPAGPWAVCRAHLWSLARQPGAYVATLALAWQHRAPGLRAAVWALFHFVEAIVLARMLDAARIDRLHNHFANSGATVGMLAAHYLSLPWSLTLHGISETDYPAGLLLPDKLDRAEFAACVSWFGRAQAMRITRPELWEKLILVRCGIDPATLPLRRRDRDPRHAQIVCVGRLSPEKGQAGLLTTLAALRARGIEAELTLVGDGPQRALLAGLSERLGLAGAVRFCGRLAEPETLAQIAAADLLVLPSFMEGLPVVLMEAMALGVPIVSSQIAGIPELVIDGETGLLFPPSQWAAMANAIARVIGDTVLAARLAANAQAKVLAEYSIDIAVRPLAERFGEALDQTAPSVITPADRNCDSTTAP